MKPIGQLWDERHQLTIEELAEIARLIETHIRDVGTSDRVLKLYQRVRDVWRARLREEAR
jgi:hypothetical protein